MNSTIAGLMPKRKGTRTDAPGDEKEGWDADELRCYVVMVKREGAKVRT